MGLRDGPDGAGRRVRASLHFAISAGAGGMRYLPKYSIDREPEHRDRRAWPSHKSDQFGARVRADARNIVWRAGDGGLWLEGDVRRPGGDYGAMVLPVARCLAGTIACRARTRSKSPGALLRDPAAARVL